MMYWHALTSDSDCDKNKTYRFDSNTPSCVHEKEICWPFSFLLLKASLLILTTICLVSNLCLQSCELRDAGWRAAL